MLCCHADQLTRFRFCPIREGDSVALPGDLSFIIGVSGVLAGDEDTWEGLNAVVAHSPVLSARLRAFLAESEELIPAARPTGSEPPLSRSRLAGLTDGLLALFMFAGLTAQANVNKASKPVPRSSGERFIHRPAGPCPR